jgi:hypothetical protein
LSIADCRLDSECLLARKAQLEGFDRQLQTVALAIGQSAIGNRQSAIFWSALPCQRFGIPTDSRRNTKAATRRRTPKSAQLAIGND